MAGPSNADLTVVDLDELEPKDTPKAKEEDVPYRIFEGSRIPVSRALGKMWSQRIELAQAANDIVYQSWEEVLRYYNNDQVKENRDTPVGRFRRGDGTENIIFSNVNTLISASYGKDPDVAIDAPDKADQDFVDTLQTLLTTLSRMRSAPGINLKPKAKRMALFGELTNCGVLKLDYQLKAESSDMVLEQLAACSEELAKAKTQEELNEVYGKLQGLEDALVVSRPSGPLAVNVLPHHLLTDPLAQQPDGLDGTWMAEKTWLPTEFLNARYTKKVGSERVSVYKPTHKMEFKASNEGTDDDEGFIGLLSSLTDDTKIELPTSYTTEERLAYINQFMTECWYIWDRTTRRVYLYANGKFDWPIWVWDDPLKLSRFFPYFIFSTALSTSGATSVGEVSYYLDQQDEVNEINREINRIRRTVYRYMFYNSNALDVEDAEKLNKALSGDTTTRERLFGIDVPEGQSLRDAFEAIAPPSIEYEALFNKAPAYSVIDRMSGANDALRGTQFKANTTEDAVQAYMGAARLRVGARTDSLEETLSDFMQALAEVCVQFMTQPEVIQLIGKEKGVKWQQMDIASFRAIYNVNVVAGSTEKPTNAYKKKEAVQVVQAIGQFASGAPVNTFKIALRVLQKAFPGEVTIHKSDWEALDNELMMNMQRGVSTGGGEGPTPTQRPNGPITTPRPQTPEEAQNAP